MLGIIKTMFIDFFIIGILLLFLPHIFPKYFPLVVKNAALVKKEKTTHYLPVVI